MFSPPQRPLCVWRLGRKKKRARGARWKGGREKRGRLFPLPIVPHALSSSSIIAIFISRDTQREPLRRRELCIVIFRWWMFLTRALLPSTMLTIPVSNLLYLGCLICCYNLQINFEWKILLKKTNLKRQHVFFRFVVTANWVDALNANIQVFCYQPVCISCHSCCWSNVIFIIN